jgi:hypothetical protein
MAHDEPTVAVDQRPECGIRRVGAWAVRAHVEPEGTVVLGPGPGAQGRCTFGEESVIRLRRRRGFVNVDDSNTCIGRTESSLDGPYAVGESPFA